MHVKCLDSRYFLQEEEEESDSEPSTEGDDDEEEDKDEEKKAENNHTEQNNNEGEKVEKRLNETFDEDNTSDEEVFESLLFSRSYVIVRVF